MSRKRAIRGAQAAAWVILVISLYFSSEVFAQDVEAGQFYFDQAGLFRWAISGLLAIVLWYARKLDSRLEILEDRVPTNLSRKIELLDGEDKNAQSLIIMLRDQVNRDHTTKAETVEHRRRIEEELRDLRTEIREANAKQSERMEQLINVLLKK